MKYKAFFIILNELSLKQIKQFFFEGKKSPTLKGLFLRGLTLGSLLFSHKTSFQTFFTKKRKLAEPCLTTPRSFLWIWSHLLKKFLMENIIFCAVKNPSIQIEQGIL